MKTITLQPYDRPVPERPLGTFEDKQWQGKAQKAYQVLYSLGIVLDQYLGCGSYGCAFQQRPMIVKLTEDPSEAANAKTMSRLECPGVARIYAVLAFDSVSDMYAIFMEPLKPITAAEKAFVWDPLGQEPLPEGQYPDRVDSLEWKRRHKHISPAAHAKQLREVRARARKLLGEDKAKSFETLIKAAKCLYANGIEYADGHHDNVLARVNSKGERELVFFDLGHSLGPAAKLTLLEQPVEQLRNAPVTMGTQLGAAIGQQLLDEFTIRLDEQRRKPKAVQWEPIEALYVGDTVMPEQAVFYRMAAQEGLDSRKATVREDAHISLEDGEVWVQTWFWLDGSGTVEQYRQVAFDAYASPESTRIDMKATVSQVPGSGAWVEGWTHVTQDLPPSTAPVELLSIPYSVQGGDIEEYLRVPGQVPEYIPKTARRAATALYALPQSRSFPIGDLFHARLALIYAMAPVHAKVREQVVAAVERAYPQYDWRKWMERAAHLAANTVESLPFDDRKRVDYGRYPTVAVEENVHDVEPSWPTHDEGLVPWERSWDQ